MSRARLLLPILVASVLVCSASRDAKAPTSGTTTFVLEGNRIYAELAFVRPDGTVHKALVFVDLGSPSMILSEELFKELQIGERQQLTFQIGDMPVHVDASAVTKDPWLPFPLGCQRKVEALLPAGVMQKYQVVLDYAQRSLTLAQPGTLKPKGLAVPFRVNEKTGLIAVDVGIDGQTYPVTIDCGSAYTWLSKKTAQVWLKDHPEWQRGTGAVGASNMRMADDGIEATGTLLRLDEMRLGPLRLLQIGALAIGPSKTGWDFIDWYSQKNPGPVIGWLGGNVLRGFRLLIDYPSRTSYWLKAADLDSHHLDQVGLTLKSHGGAYFVSAIAAQNGKPSVEGVHVGDKLLRIGGLDTKGATLGQVFEAMHGKPGESCPLILERAGKQFTVQARVTAF
ncbi:MAG TPA: hypothetical protein VE077_08995 [Candidatus Methylomirabilis sp.]|nr:hypothetical protein [Candidatus Methylomirabilis sp.]